MNQRGGLMMVIEKSGFDVVGPAPVMAICMNERVDRDADASMCRCHSLGAARDSACWEVERTSAGGEAVEGLCSCAGGVVPEMLSVEKCVDGEDVGR